MNASDTVPMRGVESVDPPNCGKVVADATVTLESRPGPGPARRVVSLETQDGALYRFQRYERGEPLVFYNREKPDGSEFVTRAPLPAHVEEVRDAIMAGDVRPNYEALMDAERQVGERLDDYREPGGCEKRVEERERSERATLRSGRVATDGGHSNDHARRIAEQLAMGEDDGDDDGEEADDE